MNTFFSTHKNLIVGAAIVIIFALIAWFALAFNARAPEPVGQEISTTTPEVTEGEQPPETNIPRTLPPEPKFTLPAGARALDDYAFINDGVVYFRSLATSTPLALPESDGATFKRLIGFESYPGADIRATCGAAGDFTFYGDKNRLYFYQVWRAPEFRASRIEVVKDSKSEDFAKIGELKYTDGNRTFTIEYQKSTTTCAYNLKKEG